jgi:hypothetical protein
MFTYLEAWMINALAFTEIPMESFRKVPSVLICIHRSMAFLIMVGKLVDVDLYVTYRQ